uniref:Uncharacterized protein n=1 Tax=Ditylenchus dipsaci TaxID=166011 RepID=A0A915CXU3_9BILA
MCGEIPRLDFHQKNERKNDVVRRKMKSPSDDQRRGTSPDRGYSSSKQHSYPNRHPDESQKSYREQKASSSHPSKSSRAEELEAKRAEMLSNAKWRDDVRNDTIEKAAQKLRKEEEQLDKVNPAFLKPLLESAASSSASVEKRLQSNKKNLQKSHDYMERSFASRKLEVEMASKLTFIKHNLLLEYADLFDKSSRRDASVEEDEFRVKKTTRKRQ